MSSSLLKNGRVYFNSIYSRVKVSSIYQAVYFFTVSTSASKSSGSSGGSAAKGGSGGLGNAVLFSIGQAFRGLGSKVLYFAGYKKRIDRYKVEEIEAAADVVVWCCDEGPAFTPGRPQDSSFVGNIVEVHHKVFRGAGGQPDQLFGH